jgi:hypothetical protein
MRLPTTEIYTTVASDGCSKEEVRAEKKRQFRLIMEEIEAIKNNVRKSGVFKTNSKEGKSIYVLILLKRCNHGYNSLGG